MEDEMTRVLWISGIFAVGFFMIYQGVMAQLGKWRRLLMYRGFPVIAPSGVFLIAIPMGLAIVSMGFMGIFPEADWIKWLMSFWFFTGTILGFWMPNWLIPRWYRWLLMNYEPVLTQMFEEVYKMGIKEWEKQTRTQTELEAWADGVAKKHGWSRMYNSRWA